jgi:NADH-ubiquinone oxidoreductase chain 2
MDIRPYLLGIALVYTFTGLTSFESLYSLVSVLSISKGSIAELSSLSSLVTEMDPLALSNLGQTASVTGEVDLNLTFISTTSNAENILQGISLGLILIVVGFLFKIAAAPFHNWSPDVYDESPTNVTIWLTIMPKLSIILLLLELEMGISLNLSQPLIVESSGSFANLFDSYFQVNIINGLNNVLKNIFLLSSLLSLIIGTVVGLAQIRIKRLLAYSTVSHIGFLLLALAVSTEQSTESLIFYLIQYTITNLNTFFILLAFGYIINSLMSSTYINSEIKFIFNLKGQFLSNPILSLSLAVCLFSMAGKIYAQSQ